MAVELDSTLDWCNKVDRQSDVLEHHYIVELSLDNHSPHKNSHLVIDTSSFLQYIKREEKRAH